MKILFHHRTQGRGAEGAHVRGMVAAFRELGHEVVVVSPPGIDPESGIGDAPARQESGAERGVARILSWISRRAPPIVFQAAELGYNVVGIARVVRLLRRERFDLVYERYAFNLVVGAVVSRLAHVPLVLEVNEVVDVPTRNRARGNAAVARVLERATLRRATAIHAVSSQLRDLIATVHGARMRCRTFVTPNAVSAAELVEAATASGSRVRGELGLSGAVVLGFAGSLSAWDRLDLLLEVVAELSSRHPALRLLVIGDGAVRPDLERRARELGVSERVRFTGWVPKPAMKEYLAAVDIGVLPHSNDYGSPVVLFELLSHGIPIVAPRLPPIEDVLVDGQAALLFEPLDKAALQSAIVSLLTDGRRRAQMGDVARASAGRHVWTANAANVLASLGAPDRRASDPTPRILVFASEFPSPAAPNRGAFIRDRVRHLSRLAPVMVISPQAWSPIDPLIRLLRPGFRPSCPRVGTLDAVTVLRPRALSIPGLMKQLDGWLMAASVGHRFREAVDHFGATVVDAHFCYPDGYAATRLGKAAGIPVSVGLRGSKDAKLIGSEREPAVRATLERAERIWALSSELRRVFSGLLGCDPSRIDVRGNGVDCDRFRPMERSLARARLSLPLGSPVMLTVGRIDANKAQARILELLPSLRAAFPRLMWLVVGPAPQARDLAALASTASNLAVTDAVRFVGEVARDELPEYYSAADVLVHAARYEGWPNVLLEAMACGTPVVCTDVGAVSDIVVSDAVGYRVDPADADALPRRVHEALERRWDRSAIRAIALTYAWDRLAADVLADLARVGRGDSSRPRPGHECDPGTPSEAPGSASCSGAPS